MSGAGKSRVVERTVELLGDASSLHFDHYDSVSQHPPNLKEWMEQGADVNEWKTPQLADDLRRPCGSKRMRKSSPETIHVF